MSHILGGGGLGGGPGGHNGQPRSRDELRKCLKVVHGGKQGATESLDAEDLRQDKFLQLHYLGRQAETPPENPQLFLWDNDFPPPWER